MIKGITDISTIQKELREYEQVDIPYTFTPNTKIKYITLEESTNSEGFFIGGEYSRMGNERIILQNGPSIWSVPIRVRDDNNDIIYESKFFVPKNDTVDMEKSKDIKELEKTIKAQQMVIEKMTTTIKNDKIKLQKYENIIQKLRN
tara:strand:- start:582 stop:1019 length:438 start_codon:yes stop_codon:yes gene_type:complete